MLNETRVSVIRRAGPIPDYRPEGWLTWIRQVVQRAASAASHLQGPERTVTLQLDHLLSLVLTVNTSLAADATQFRAATRW